MIYTQVFLPESRRSGSSTVANQLLASPEGAHMSNTAIASSTIVSSVIPDATHHSSVGALIMAADYRGLGVARSLGRPGIPVWVLTQGGHLVAATSRYVRRIIPLPAYAVRIDVPLLLH